jgi:DNA-binding transcriptional MerR regulator
MNETRSTDHVNTDAIARMTIGEFARQTQLTQKALRLYDALGLLEPRFTDPQSGYRYYAADQLERAQLIAWLRQLEMPLNRIATLLELDGQKAASELIAYWHEVEAQMREQRNLVLFLEAKLNPLEGKGKPMFEIQTRSVPEQKIATIQRHVFKDGIGQFIPEAHSTLFGLLAAAGAQPSGAPFVMYYGKVDVDSDGPAEACVPFIGSLEPSGEVRIRIDPAHDEAFIVMTRGSVDGPELMQGYDALFTYMRERGQTSMGGREIYFEDAPWDSLHPDQPAFDIAVPFA